MHWWAHSFAAAVSRKHLTGTDPWPSYVKTRRTEDSQCIRFSFFFFSLFFLFLFSPFPRELSRKNFRVNRTAHPASSLHFAIRIKKFFILTTQVETGARSRSICAYWIDPIIESFILVDDPTANTALLLNVPAFVCFIPAFVCVKHASRQTDWSGPGTDWIQYLPVAVWSQIPLSDCENSKSDRDFTRRSLWGL